MGERAEIRDRVDFPEGPVLALDTSTASMTVALTDGGKLLCERTVAAERNHSVRLLPEVEALLHTAGLRPRDVRAVAAGCGPGSYTGVRIGVTMAKTFAWALGIPVYGVSSLAALALGAYRAAGDGAVAPLGAAPDAAAPAAGRAAWIVPALDGRRGQAYTALFAVGEDGALRRLAPDAVLPFREQAEAWLRAPERPGTVLFAGEVDGAFAGMLDELAAGAGSSAVVLRRPWAIQARDVAAAARLLGPAALVGDAHDLAPNYTQLAEAEAKLIAAAAARDRELRDEGKGDGGI